MNSYKIYTRKTWGLDNRVWRLLIAMIILPLILLSYRLADEKKCIPFSFTEKSLGTHANGVFYTGETISFAASIPDKDITWDFNDNSTDAGATVYHQFLKEGIYAVTARGNSLCEIEKQITIKNPPAPPPVSNVVGSIAGPTSSYTFTEQRFTWPGPAKSYVWTIPNHQSLGVRTGQTIVYTFPYPAKYTVQVELDSDRTKRYTLEVVVEEKPRPNQLPDKVEKLIVLNNPPPQETAKKEDTDKNPPPADPTPAAPDNTKPKNKIIPNDLFLTYLEKVQDKKMAIAQFEEYGVVESTPVIANGKDHQTFGWLCNELDKKKGGILGIGKKKIKLESVTVQRTNGGVVTAIQVTYK